MPTMGNYCKAYPAAYLRKFSGWKEAVPPLRVSPDSDSTTAVEETEYFYLQENYTVTAGVFLDEGIAFADVTPEWKTFCTDELKFVVPARQQAIPAVQGSTGSVQENQSSQ